MDLAKVKESTWGMTSKIYVEWVSGREAAVAAFVEVAMAEVCGRRTETMAIASCSRSTRRLKLELLTEDVKLSTFRSVAPNIRSFDMELQKSGENFNPEIFSQIWKLWPQLEEIKIRAKAYYEEGSFDAVFLRDS